MSFKLKRNFGKEFCVYRYVENATGKVIYVGKTNSSLRARVTAHRYETAFQKANPFHVEYIELSNSVETDCIEKFLINKWKPPINEKDNISGLTASISLENLKWISYSEYEKTYKNPKAVKKVIQEANKNAIFFHEALSAREDGDQFVVPFCGAGISIEHDGISENIAELEVFPCLGGYRHTLKPNMYEELHKHMYEIEYSIWSPVLSVCNMTDDEELLYSIYMQQIEFGEQIDNFANNGFEDENSLYQCDFHAEYPGGDIYLPYQRVFDNFPRINSISRTISGEINQFTYEQEMPYCKNELNKQIISFVYGLKDSVLLSDRAMLKMPKECELEM